MLKRSSRFGMSLILLLCPLTVRTLAGQEPTQEAKVGRDLPAAVLADRAAYVLAYDHTTGRVELRNHKGDVQERWDTA